MRLHIVKNPMVGAFFETLSVVDDPKLPPGMIIMRTEKHDYALDVDLGKIHRLDGPMRFESHDPECGDLMTWRDFVDGVRSLGLTDYDGFGEFATEHDCSNIPINPGQLDDALNGMPDDHYPDPPFRWVTHVVWYNR